MKKMNLLFLSFFIMSCASQSAPPLNLQDSEDANNRDESNRAELPETPEVTFASEEVENSDIPDSGPAAPDVKKEIVEDIKDELKVDYAGVRRKPFAANEEPKDFISNEETNLGLANLINLIGIESPGLTASLAIGKYVRSVLSSQQL